MLRILGRNAGGWGDEDRAELSAAGATIQQPTLTSAERLQYALGSGVTQGVTPTLQQEAQQIHTQVTVNPGTALGVMLTEGLQ